MIHLGPFGTFWILLGKEYWTSSRQIAIKITRVTVFFDFYSKRVQDFGLQAFKPKGTGLLASFKPKGTGLLVSGGSGDFFKQKKAQEARLSQKV